MPYVGLVCSLFIMVFFFLQMQKCLNVVYSQLKNKEMFYFPKIVASQHLFFGSEEDLDVKTSVYPVS